MPCRHIANVDDVEPAVDVGRHLSLEEPLDEVHRASWGRVRSEHERRIHDRHRQSPRGKPERFNLRLVLRVHVGDADVADVEDGRLVDRLSGLADSDRGNRRGHDDALDLCLERRLEHHPGSPHVRIPDGLAIPVPQRGLSRRCGKRARPPTIALRTALRSVTSPIARSKSRSSRWSRRLERRASRRSSSPLFARARTTCEPMKPVAPVTRVFPICRLIVELG